MSTDGLTFGPAIDPPGTYADTYFGFLEALEALFERPIDLVVSSTITNPYFRESIDESKVLIFAA